MLVFKWGSDGPQTAAKKGCEFGNAKRLVFNGTRRRSQMVNNLQVADHVLSTDRNARSELKVVCRLSLREQEFCELRAGEVEGGMSAQKNAHSFSDY